MVYSNLSQNNKTIIVVEETTKVGEILEIIEHICLGWSALLIILRFLFCSNKLHFFLSPINIIEIISVLPYFIYTALYYANIRSNDLDFLRALRMFSVMRVTRYSSGLRAFGTTIKKSYREIFILLVYLFVGILVFGALVFYFEKDIEGTAFTSMPASFWWAVITLTTVLNKITLN